jgi:hypothetical protein
MAVFAVLFSLFQCFAIAVGFVAGATDAPDPWLSVPLIWLGILFGPATYLFARTASNGSIVNLAVVVLSVVAIVLGFTSGRFPLFPYYHQIISMGVIVSSLAIASYNFPWSPRSSKTKNRILLGILALGPMVGATIWLTLLSGPIVAVRAAQAAQGQPYCTFNYWTTLRGLGEYKQSRGIWDLDSYWMTSPFMSAGGSGDFQFGFHGLLLTPKELFNWSYQSQRFERVTDISRRNLGIGTLSCDS